MGLTCCGCTERKTTTQEDKTSEHSKETLKNLLTTMDERSLRTGVLLYLSLTISRENSKYLRHINFTPNPGLMDALGIANEYWRNSRIKQYDEQTGKIFRYQIAGLIRGEKHIYTSNVRAYKDA